MSRYAGDANTTLIRVNLAWPRRISSIVIYMRINRMKSDSRISRSFPFHPGRDICPLPLTVLMECLSVGGWESLLMPIW